MFCSLGLGAAAVDDGHVAERAAIGQFAADVGNEAVQFLPVAFAVGLAGKDAGDRGHSQHRTPLAGRVELTLRADRDKARHLYLPW